MKRIADDLGVPVSWLIEAATWAPLTFLAFLVVLVVVLSGLADPLP